MRSQIRNILCILIGVVSFNAVPAQAVDMYLCLKKGNGELLKGESQSQRHKDCIDVLAWSWGASQSGTTHLGGGGGAGKANFQDLSLTKYIDTSSPELLGLLASGGFLSELILYVYRLGCESCGSQPIHKLEVVDVDVLVTSLSTGGSGGEEKLTENLSFNFPKYEYCYTPLKDGDVSIANEVCTTWDIQANTP